LIKQTTWEEKKGHDFPKYDFKNLTKGMKPSDKIEDSEFISVCYDFLPFEKFGKIL